MPLIVEHTSASLFPLMDPIERRRHARYRCEVSVEVSAADEQGVCHGILADICLGGCYVSLVSPFSPGTAVLLRVTMQQVATVLAGRTVTSVPGSGMGIEFAADPESAAPLQALIQLLEERLSDTAAAG